jgi:hypothetical protein
MIGDGCMTKIRYLHTKQIKMISLPSTSKPMTSEIENILNKNTVDDLREFIKRRKCLNSCNLTLVYLFHIVQSAGILVTTIAAGYDMKELIWVGVGLNVGASLLNVFEKTNNGISKHLLKDIKSIREGTYVDESECVDEKRDKDKEEKRDKEKEEKDGKEGKDEEKSLLFS